MSEVKRLIVHLHGGRDDGMNYDTSGGDSFSIVCAQGVWAVTQGEVGKVFLGQNMDYTHRLANKEVERPCYHKYQVTERTDGEDGTVTLRAEFIGVYDPNKKQ